MAYRRECSDSADPARKCAEVRTTAEINGFIACVIAELGQAGFCDRDRFAVRLALEEAIINAIKHGNREDPAKWVRVSYSINSGAIVTEIEDQGPGFNPNKIPNPLAPENLERPGGRGVFLMRHYMTFVQYNERGNGVLLTKTRQQ